MGEIICGRSIMSDVTDALSTCVFTVTDSYVAPLYKGLTHDAFVIPAGENNKNLDTLTRILTEMQKRGIKRGNRIAAFGGGVVGDITGLAAALYMRGIEWVSIPTTLLAMVDSGIGGKTAIDFNGVKNVLGAFHMPSQIVINVDFLETLKKREWLSGSGEMIKTCLLDEATYLMLRRNNDAVFSNDIDRLFPIIKACVEIKNKIVSQDPTEQGRRKVLNIGHTVGHALESLESYKLSHGEYVLKGMMVEATMFKTIMNEEFYREFIVFLKCFTSPPRLSGKSVASIAISDKKNVGSTITVMVPIRPGEIKEMRLERDEFIKRYDVALSELIA